MEVACPSASIGQVCSRLATGFSRFGTLTQGASSATPPPSQASNLQLHSDVQQRAQRQAAQEAVLAQSMQQLAVARQLLQEFSVPQEHAKLNSSEGEVRRLERLATSKSREVRVGGWRCGAVCTGLWRPPAACFGMGAPCT